MELMTQEEFDYLILEVPDDDELIPKAIDAYAAALARIATLEEACMNYAVNVCPEQDRIIAAQREQIERLLSEAAHS